MAFVMSLKRTKRVKTSNPDGSEIFQEDNRWQFLAAEDLGIQVTATSHSELLNALAHAHAHSVLLHPLLGKEELKASGKVDEAEGRAAEQRQKTPREVLERLYIARASPPFPAVYALLQTACPNSLLHPSDLPCL